MLYSELFTAALKKLKKTEWPAAVEILLAKAFGFSRTQFWLLKNQPVRDRNGVQRFRRLLRRLLADEPLAYILKEKDFYLHRFTVSPAVLIPRPETELLVEKALSLLPGQARVLDIGSGCGNIAISLALNSAATVIALEKSDRALTILNKNIERCQAQAKVRALAGDLFPPAPDFFDMIVSNPPYLSQGDWQRAPRCVKGFEPRAALVAGVSGTEILEKIIAVAPGYLKAGGYLLLEIGQGQAAKIRSLLKAVGMSLQECVLDYQGIERVMVARR